MSFQYVLKNSFQLSWSSQSLSRLTRLQRVGEVSFKLAGIMVYRGADFQSAASPACSRPAAASQLTPRVAAYAGDQKPARQSSAAEPQPKERGQPCPRVCRWRTQHADKAVRAPRIVAARDGMPRYL